VPMQGSAMTYAMGHPHHFTTMIRFQVSGGGLCLSVCRRSWARRP